MDKRSALRLCGCILSGGLGLLLVLYPLISNSLYENRQDGVIQAYAAAVTDYEQKPNHEADFATAQAYNRQLLMGTAGEVPDVLDISGSGVIATLTIPKLSLTLPVYYGTEPDTLEQGIGVLETNSLPVGGIGTHCILCGHSGLPTAKLFSDLPLMERGDSFYLDVLGERLTYAVDQITTVRPEDVSQIAIAPENDYCTLLTCTPIGLNTHRLLVRGTRVENAEEEQAPVTPEEPTESVWLQEYLTSIAVSLGVVTALALILLVLHLLKRRRQ